MMSLTSLSILTRASDIIASILSSFVFPFRAFGDASGENLVVRFSDFPKFMVCIVVRRYDAETVVDNGCAVVRNEPESFGDH
jgi:hypothetical protein